MNTSNTRTLTNTDADPTYNSVTTTFLNTQSQIITPLNLTTVSTDANTTITVTQFSPGGIIYRTGATAGRIDTFDTLSNFLSAFGTGIITLTYYNNTTQTITIAAGASFTTFTNTSKTITTKSAKTIYFDLANATMFLSN
jgi:hypothetical protein